MFMAVARSLFMVTHIDYRPENLERLLNVEQMERLRSHISRRAARLMRRLQRFSRITPVHKAMEDEFVDTWQIIGQGEGLTYPSDDPKKSASITSGYGKTATP